jgi:hypothetical protein
VWLVWSSDPESYAGGSVATGRASDARQIKGDDQTKKGYRGPPGWGLGKVLQTHPIKSSVEKLLKLEIRRQFWRRLRSTKDCNVRRRRIK